VDLAVEGLPSCAYFAALAALMELFGGPVDRVRMEEAVESLRQRVLKEGSRAPITPSGRAHPSIHGGPQRYNIPVVFPLDHSASFSAAVRLPPAHPLIFSCSSLLLL
jgi:hypothetical protein